MKPITSRSGGSERLTHIDINRSAAHRMRAIATAMLLVMATIYFGLSPLEDVHPLIGFIRAFAEAAMVGGLADWFAVTALFRHPLGIPIPHTAIIPRNKDRIGGALAVFLRDNFLQPAVIARRTHSMDIAGAVGRFLQSPGAGKGRLRMGASRLIHDVVSALDQDRLGRNFKGAVRKRAQALDLATPMGQLLEAAMADERHGPMLDAAIRWAFKMLDANEAVIREIVYERANTILRLTGLDHRLANEVLDGIYKLLGDMAADPDHPLRSRTEASLHHLAAELRTDDTLRTDINRWKMEMIDNPAIVAWLDGIWEQARGAILNAVRDPDTTLAGQLGTLLTELGANMQQDVELNRQINRFARRAIVGAVSSYGDNIVTLVSETIRGWDAGTITERVENAVGRDLQYIRINGTVVGGLVGLCLHAIDYWG